MKGHSLLCAAIVPLCLSVQGSGQPSRETGYAGALACRSCHPEIYRTQEVSNHARSLRLPRDVAEFQQKMPFTMSDPGSKAHLTIRRNEEDESELVARNGESEHRLRLSWVFGSGTKGMTPVGQGVDGQFVEARVSWYGSLKTFDLTTGAIEYQPQTVQDSLGRPLTSQEIGACFGCHTTAFTGERAIPDREEMGVRCERCHGPGSAHIKQISTAGGPDMKIIHPGKLKAFAQVQMCGQCHGRPPRDTDFAAISRIEASPISVRFPSQRLVLSRCFNESEANMKCTECHDPHTDVSHNFQLYDRACLKCHAPAKKKGIGVCRLGKEKCASCHMPVARVMVHSRFTDHWVRIVRGKGAAGL